MTAEALISLVRRLDLGLTNPEEDCPLPYLELRGYVGRNNALDYEATAMVRALAREKLGGFPLEEIGSAVLVEIDRGPEVEA